MTKLYCCFVVETRVYKEFYYKSDADKFVSCQTRLGNQVLRAINRIGV